MFNWYTVVQVMMCTTTAVTSQLDVVSYPCGQICLPVIIRGDFDVGYYQASTIVSIRSPQDVKKIWNDVKREVKHVLRCDGRKESNTVPSKLRKQSKKKESESDYNKEVVETVTNKKKSKVVRMKNSKKL
jgi:hypothetical protein